jgi:hypothetical protein
MKKISVVIAVVVAAAIISCTQSENVAPARQQSLGLVVKANSNSSVSNMLLLKDGRTANPVSGIPNFNTLSAGRKLSITFTSSATHSGIVDIHVTRFASAQDSTFVPTPPAGDTTSLTKVFKGVFYKADMADSANFHTSYDAQITFSGSNYTDGYASGTFVTAGNTITFTDLSSTSNQNHILNGTFNYVLNQNYLYMWVIRNGEYLSYSLKRE